MSDGKGVKINRLATGVKGLDAVLGGGIPEYSFNLIAGEPGSGKTTLGQQIMFANATRERGAIYFTVLGEPPVKMLRYQQQFSFFDHAKIDRSVRFVNLSEEVLSEDLDQVLRRIVLELDDADPGIVIVDSFRTIVSSSGPASGGERNLQAFLQRLGLHLTSCQATSFLIGEYFQEDRRDNPLFTVADGIIWLTQNVTRNSVSRKIQAVKVRGQAQMQGLHTMRISDDGVEVFPRIHTRPAGQPGASTKRLSTGIEGLDEMMHGGIPAGNAFMVAGPAGTGKTTFAAKFISAGVAVGESAVLTVFEEYPDQYLERAASRDPIILDAVRAGRLKVIYLRPLDLTFDETLAEIIGAVESVGATRVVIDSIPGLEIALAPAFREDLRESLYRLVGALTGRGVTVFMTSESLEGSTQFTMERVSFISDCLLLQRYVELKGRLEKVLAVVKMRGSDHSQDFRFYSITAEGVTIGGTLHEYQGILRGAVTRIPDVAGV